MSQDGVSPDPDNIAKIANWLIPRNVWEVCSILGMGNYYCRFVKDFSQKAQPLVALTKKNNQFRWSLECQTAFDEIKQALTGPDIMAFPTVDDLYILDCDVADDSIDCVLSQKQSNVEKVIAHGSQTLGKSERNFCATDWDLLVVKYFLEYYKHYLLGCHFRVRSGHEALKWLFSMKEPKHCIARWIEVLSGFDFESEYCPGKKHGNANALSRCPNPRDCSCPVAKEHDLPGLSCKKCLGKAEIMLGALPARVSQPFQVTSRTTRTFQMCSQTEDTTNNSLEVAGAVAMGINYLPTPAEVLGDNPALMPIGAGGTDISGVIRVPIIQPTMTHGYFTWSQNKRHDNTPHMAEGLKCQSNTKGPKPSPESQTTAEKQMECALGGDKSVSPRKGLAEGGPTKPEFRAVAHP